MGSHTPRTQLVAITRLPCPSGKPVSRPVVLSPHDVAGIILSLAVPALWPIQRDWAGQKDDYRVQCPAKRLTYDVAHLSDLRPPRLSPIHRCGKKMHTLSRTKSGCTVPDGSAPSVPSIRGGSLLLLCPYPHDSNSGGRTLFRRSRQPIHAPAWILPSILTMCVPDVRLGSGSACAANASLAPPKLLPQSCNPHGQTPFGENGHPRPNHARPRASRDPPPDSAA